MEKVIKKLVELQKVDNQLDKLPGKTRRSAGKTDKAEIPFSRSSGEY